MPKAVPDLPGLEIQTVLRRGSYDDAQERGHGQKRHSRVRARAGNVDQAHDHAGGKHAVQPMKHRVVVDVDKVRQERECGLQQPYALLPALRTDGHRKEKEQARASSNPRLALLAPPRQVAGTKVPEQALALLAQGIQHRHG
eukprot:CAMPEP_0118974038 /NCGR_PEP_ID=MMETSP1173-20130426/11041_1 /TAXON_ID=1034831 /ORGANISM="Rhizochromulina marina cf, Strain CCMP1243" /LENGTH=141 /DNA_ID=CAMNT_0006923741 /DNA_START=128 /DNA_END=549 /DNA_ORIENTATION=+